MMANKNCFYKLQLCLLHFKLWICECFAYCPGRAHYASVVFCLDNIIVSSIYAHVYRVLERKIRNAGAVFCPADWELGAYGRLYIHN